MNDDRAWTLTCENYVWHASPHETVRVVKSAGPILVVPAVPPEHSNDEVELKQAAANFRKQFGGGMVPFDTAYQQARNEGFTIAESQMTGAVALIESFVSFAAASTPTSEGDDGTT